MHGEIIDIITDLEQRIDTNALVYRDICYWPLVRARVWGGLLRQLAVARGEGDPPALTTNTGPKWPDVGRVNAALAGPPDLGLLKADAKPPKPGHLTPTTLMFARPEEYSDTVAGKAFARVIDSVVECAADVGPVTKLELADPRTMTFARRHPSLFIDLNLAGQGVAFDPPGELGGFADIAALIAARVPGITLDHASLTTDLGKIFYFARIFEKLLRQLLPRLFVLSVAYHPVGYAWMLACRWAGVKSVDLQHGRLGPAHGTYTHLTAAPRDGYAILPDHIWCWGETTAEDIAAHKNPDCLRHGGIVGGNAWLAKWRGDTSALEPKEAQTFLERHAGRRKILVSLQPYDVPMVGELLRAMKQSPPEWLWLLRLHPLRRHIAPEIKEILARASVTNVEMDESTTLPLYFLLRHVDHHVTAFSSVVAEAAAFDVRSSLTTEVGRDAFARYIADRVCRYTPTAEELNAHIAACLAVPRAPLHDRFIDAGSDTAQRALAQLLG